jgi:hypothetical protein
MQGAAQSSHALYVDTAALLEHAAQRSAEWVAKQVRPQSCIRLTLESLCCFYSSHRVRSAFEMVTLGLKVEGRHTDQQHIALVALSSG